MYAVGFYDKNQLNSRIKYDNQSKVSCVKSHSLNIE